MSSRKTWHDLNKATHLAILGSAILVLGAALLTGALGVRAQERDFTHRFNIQDYLEMDDPVRAAEAIRADMRHFPILDTNIEGKVSGNAEEVRLPNKQTVKASGIEVGLDKYVASNGDGTLSKGARVCVLRVKECRTPREFYGKIADILSSGLHLRRKPLDMWTFYCAPSLSQLAELQKNRAVHSIFAFRPEYKYDSLIDPGSPLTRLQIEGLWPIESVERQSIEDLGYRIEVVSGTRCVATGMSIDPMAVASLWWVRSLRRDESFLVPDLEESSHNQTKSGTEPPCLASN